MTLNFAISLKEIANQVTNKVSPTIITRYMLTVKESKERHRYEMLLLLKQGHRVYASAEHLVHVHGLEEQEERSRTNSKLNSDLKLHFFQK